MKKDIVTRTFNNGKFRMKVVRLGKDLVSVQEESHHDDVYGWERGKHFVIHRDEIVAAASLLGITNTLFKE